MNPDSLSAKNRYLRMPSAAKSLIHNVASSTAIETGEHIKVLEDKLIRCRTAERIAEKLGK